MDFLRQTVNILADLLITLIFLRVVLSWFVPRNSNALMDFLINSTEPIMAPIRKAVPLVGNLDFSPIIAYFLVDIIRNLLNHYVL